MAKQDVSQRGLFCTVLTLHGAGGYGATAPSIPAERERLSRLRVMKGAASAVFPEDQAIERSQKGMLKCFSVSTWRVHSTTFWVITPLVGNSLAAEVAEGVRVQQGTCTHLEQLV